ncbi:hypothetical protein OROGR_009189 [Orobanche gracilis]
MVANVRECIGKPKLAQTYLNLLQNYNPLCSILIGSRYHAERKQCGYDPHYPVRS